MNRTFHCTNNMKTDPSTPFRCKKNERISMLNKTGYYFAMITV